MTADDIDDGLPRLPIFDGTKQPQHRPAPSKLTLTAYDGGSDRAATALNSADIPVNSNPDLRLQSWKRYNP